MKKINVEKAGHYSGHRDCIYALERSLSPHSFYTGAAEGYVVEWNYAEKSDGRLLIKSPDPVYSMLLLSAEKLVLLGSSKGNLYLVDLENNRELRIIEAHAGAIFSLKEIPGSDTLISAGGDGSIGLWNRNDMSIKLKLSLAEKSARAVAVSTAAGKFAVGLSDYSIRIFDNRSFAPLKTIPAHENSVFAVCWSPNGKYLLSGGRDAKLKVWSADDDFALYNSIPAHLGHIYSITYNPAGKLFATCSMDKTIKIWDAEDLELLKVIDHARNEGHTSSVNNMFWADDEHLVSCSDDKTAMVWKVTADS